MRVYVGGKKISSLAILFYRANQWGSLTEDYCVVEKAWFSVHALMTGPLIYLLTVTV